MNNREVDRARYYKRVKMMKIGKSILIMLAIAMFLWFSIGYYSESSSIYIVQEKHQCELKGCSYEFLVENKSKYKIKSYVRVTAFKNTLRYDVETSYILATDRVEFSLNSRESRLIKGLLKTEIKPSRFTLRVGINDEGL